jgi:hypothetical protein
LLGSTAKIITIFDTIYSVLLTFMGSAMIRSLLAIALAATVSLPTALSAGELSIGASVLGKAGINATETPEFTKTDYNINSMPDIGVSALYLFSNNSNTGVMLDLGYDSYSYRMRYYEANPLFDGAIMTHSVRKISIAPSLYLGGFQLGVAFGMNSGYAQLDNDGNTLSDNDSDVPGFTTELRVGAMIPIMRGKTSSLNLNSRGGYMLTETFTNAQRALNSAISPTHNSKIASLGLGLSYYFTVVD